MESTQERGKQAAGKAAADLVEEGMIVGLGTGTTAAHFMTSIGKRIREGLQIQAIPSSKATAHFAEECRIPLIDINETDHIDMTVDGADEVDPNKQMIKGGGGALTREKIIAAASLEMIVLIDPSKIVKKLGSFPLPIEVIPFGWKATFRHLEAKGVAPELRMHQGLPFQTDNDNYILDIRIPHSTTALKNFDELLNAIPGVVETGLFVGLADRVLVGHPDGSVTPLQ